MKGGEELIIYIFLAILASIAYCELLWWLVKVKEKKRPIEVIKQTFRFMIGLNFILAIIFSSLASIVFTLVMLFYYMIIIEYRSQKNRKDSLC